MVPLFSDIESSKKSLLLLQGYDYEYGKIDTLTYNQNLSS